MTNYDHQLEKWPSAPAILWPCDVAVVDLETTGFDPRAHALTEIAVIRCDSQFRERDRVHLRVDVPNAAALDVDPWIKENTAWGRSPSAGHWVAAGAIPLRTALNRAGKLLEGAAIVAHYLPFEADWLRHMYGRARPETAGREWIMSSDWRRHSIDTRDLMSPIVAQGKAPGRSLPAACEHFKIDLKDHHNAACDAGACLALARRLLRELR